MKPLDRDHSILEHIVSYCDQIEQTVERFGDDYSVFQTDPIYRNAAALCILQIGELVGKLSETFRAQHAEIPWRQINSARFCDRCGARQPEADMYASSQTAAMAVEQPIAPQKKKFDWQIPKDSAGEQLTIQQYNALLAGLLLYGFALCTVICHAFAIDLP